MARVITLLAVCFVVGAMTPIRAAEGETTLRYDPSHGAGSLYDINLSALLDYPLARGAPVSGEMVFCLVPQAGEAGGAGGAHEVVVCIQEGVFRMQGQPWDFSDETLSWTWKLTPQRRVLKDDAEPVTGLLAILQLFFEFVFAVEFPEEPVAPGAAWTTEKTVETGEGGSITLSGSHSLVSVEPDENGESVATVDSRIEIPVDATFLGARFVGVINGSQTVRFSVSDGELLSIETTGEAHLREDGGALELTLRDINLTVDRSAVAPPEEAQEWIAAAGRNPSLSGSSLADAILNANVVEYLRDDWHVYYPRAGFGAADGILLGGGAVGRYNGDYLYELDAYFGMSSLRGAYQLNVTRGFPAQPTNQQYITLASSANSRLARFGASHFSGRRLGAMGIPRMRYSVSASWNRLMPHSGVFRSSGDANYMSISAHRYRSGKSVVGLHSLDWDAGAGLSVGLPALGSDYGFALASGNIVGLYHLDDKESLAARFQLTVGMGDLPDQFRTPLVDREVLRGFDTYSAPLTSKALTGSLEWRRQLGTTPFFDRIGANDWWIAAFVDAGIGGDSLQEMLNSKVYVDVGVTVRVGIEYEDVPIYGFASIAWPVSGGRSDPRLSVGLDWAF